MRTDTFVGGILFAAAAAIAFWIYAGLAGPYLDGTITTASFLAGAMALYIPGIATSRPRGIRVAVVTGIVGMAIAGLTPTLLIAVVALAVLFAIARGAVASQGSIPRIALREGLLGAGGLALAAIPPHNSLLGVVVAIWGFFLVQSFFCAFATAMRRAHTGGDPFETAYARAVAILDERGV